MRAWIQSPMREAEGLSRLHNTITDWPDSGYTRRIVFIPGAPPPWPWVRASSGREHLSFWHFTLFEAFRSSLRDLLVIRTPVPGLKAWAIFGSPSGTTQKLRTSLDNCCDVTRLNSTNSTSGTDSTLPMNQQARVRVAASSPQPSPPEEVRENPLAPL